MNDTKRPLGEWLRQRREELGISLEKAETDTRIRIQYLQALESEDFQSLPNQVVLRGFLRNYASYLGLDTQEAGDRYTALAGPPEPEPDTVETPPLVASELFRPVALHTAPARGRRGLLAGLLAVLLIGAAILVWLNYPWIKDNWFRSKPPEVTSTATVQLATATLTPTKAAAPATFTPVQATHTPKPTVRLEITVSPSPFPSPSPSPSPPIYDGVFVEVAITGTSWLQVTVDGLREFQGELQPGEYRSWKGDQRVELRIGNAGGVQVTVNGQKLGALGGINEVIDVAFEKVGDVIVTPSVTVTSTVTPTVTSTATPTPAITPAPPITPTVTITPTAAITPTAVITPTTGP